MWGDRGGGSIIEEEIKETFEGVISWVEFYQVCRMIQVQAKLIHLLAVVRPGESLLGQVAIIDQNFSYICAKIFRNIEAHRLWGHNW